MIPARPSFRKGRSAPRWLWQASPSSGTLWSAAALPELAEVFGLHQQLGYRLFFPSGTEVHQDLTAKGVVLAESQLHVLAKLEHELDHVQRHLGTSFGWWHHLIMSRLVDLFFQRSLLEPTADPAVLPWYLPYESAIRPGESLDIYDNRRQFLRFEHLLELLECNSISTAVPTHEQGQAAVDLLLSELCGAQGKSRQPSFLSEAGTPAADADGCGDGWFPVLPDRTGKPAKFGASALLELFAMTRENALLSLARCPHRVDYDRFRSPIYTLAHDAWFHWARLPKIDSQTNELWATAGIPRAATLPLELFMAADLALWPPIGPEGCIENATGVYCWRDLHPGWRFVRLLNLLRDNRHWHPCKDYDQRVDRILQERQAAWCRYFHWPTPSEIGTAWQRFFDESLRRGECQGRFVEDDSVRVQSMLALQEYRLQHPSQVALLFPRCSGALFNSFTGVVGREPDGQSQLLVRSVERNYHQPLGYPMPVALALHEGLEIFGRHDVSDSDQFRSYVDRSRYAGLLPPITAVIERYRERHYAPK